MNYFRIFITIALFASALASANAAVWTIKPDGTGDASTVQDGIIAASPGDTVRLAPGTYTGLGNRDINFMGKAIVVDSEAGAEVTIIECQGLGRGFLMVNCQDPSTVLSGITVKSGNSGYDVGGLICGDGEYTYNLISENTARSRGGGIHSESASPIIGHNTVCENSTPNGGGMCFYLSGSPLIEYNIIAFNAHGTAIGCSGAIPTVSCCDIFGNAGGDAICGIDGGNNISLDPQFCGIVGSGYYSLQADSPCLGNHDLPCGDQYMGALPAACGSVAVENKTWGAIKALYRD